jgi:hypothetical protein
MDWLNKLRINPRKSLIMCNGDETGLNSNFIKKKLELEVSKTQRISLRIRLKGLSKTKKNS